MITAWKVKKKWRTTHKKHQLLTHFFRQSIGSTFLSPVDVDVDFDWEKQNCIQPAYWNATNYPRWPTCNEMQFRQGIIFKHFKFAFLECFAVWYVATSINSNKVFTLMRHTKQKRTTTPFFFHHGIRCRFKNLQNARVNCVCEVKIRSRSWAKLQMKSGTSAAKGCSKTLKLFSFKVDNRNK